MKRILGKYVLLILWIAVLAFLKFYLFNLDYDRFHRLVSISTFLLYLTVLILIMVILARKKLVVLSNITLIIALLVLLEFVSFIGLGIPKKEWKQYNSANLPPEHKSSYLGNVPWADSVMNDFLIVKGDTYANVHYSIDSLNRRITPNRDTSKDKYALFFGCSVCFGFALEDNETIPFLMQEKTNSYNAYNYSYSGWGPHQMLSLLEHENLADQVSEDDGYAICIFLWSHIRRAICDYQVYTGWGHTMPYYSLENDSLKFKGDFTNRKYFSYLYEKVEKFYSVKWFQLNFPVYTNEDHYTLVAEIMEKSKELYSKQFGNEDFTVIIYPDIWDELDDERMSKLLDLFEERNIDYIDYSKKEYLIKDHYILKDGHPNLKSNNEITDLLVDELKLN